MARKNQLLRPLLLGSGVTILTPIASNIITKIPLLGTTDVNLGVITLGTAIAAGVSAFVTEQIAQRIKATKA